MTVYNFGKFQAGGEWRTESVFYSPYILDEITERVTTGDATVTIDSLVELIAGGGIATDLITATICGDESKVVVGHVLNNEWNRNALAVDNSKDSYFELTKGTAAFASGTLIDIVFLMPGLILNGKVEDSQTIAPFTAVIASALGKIKLFDTGVDSIEALLGKYMSVVTSVASLQWAAWKVGA